MYSVSPCLFTRSESFSEIIGLEFIPKIAAVSFWSIFCFEEIFEELELEEDEEEEDEDDDVDDADEELLWWWESKYDFAEE